MNKTDLIASAADRAGLSKTDTAKALDAIVATVVDAVSKGDSVALVGFGTFKPVSRAARTGKNPKTGEALTIPASIQPKFTAGSGFKASVSKK